LHLSSLVPNKERPQSHVEASQAKEVPEMGSHDRPIPQRKENQKMVAEAQRSKVAMNKISVEQPIDPSVEEKNDSMRNAIGNII